jgi:hypothetical protein
MILRQSKGKIVPTFNQAPCHNRTLVSGTQPHEFLTLFARKDFKTKNKQFIMCEKKTNQNSPNNHTSG